MSRHLLSLRALALSFAVLAPAACGDNATSGPGGSAGSAGTGPGGNAGTAGVAGSSGSAGNAGSSGNAGTAGNAGNSGSGGSGGSGGSAGTGGSGSPICDAYCKQINENCVGDDNQYIDEASCKGVCAHFAPGKEGDTSGDTLGCRVYHSGAPSIMDANVHCPHAGPLGDGICSESNCDSFCSLAVAICGDQAMPPYASKQACLTACAGFVGTDQVPYNTTVLTGDSLACRMYHLTVAAIAPDLAQVHCQHIRANSDPCQ
jgi:hypothetical protein